MSLQMTVEDIVRLFKNPSRLLSYTRFSISLISLMYFFPYQFQKQGKDVEKVKQRLAEIANYVDKVLNAILRSNEQEHLIRSLK